MSRFWEQRERLDVAGTHHSEVPLIEGRYLADRETLGQGDHRCVRRAQRQVVVAAHQLSHADEVRGCQVDDLEVSSTDRVQELRLDLGAHPCGQHVADLSDDGLWDEQPSARQPQPTEQFRARMVVIVVAGGSRDQWARVAENHERRRPKPSARYSSTFRAMSVRPPFATPAPKNAGGHSPRGLSEAKRRTSASTTST